MLVPKEATNQTSKMCDSKQERRQASKQIARIQARKEVVRKSARYPQECIEQRKQAN